MAGAVTVILLLIVFILIAILVLGYFKYMDEVNKPIVKSQCPETNPLDYQKIPFFLKYHH